MYSPSPPNLFSLYCFPSPPSFFRYTWPACFFFTRAMHSLRKRLYWLTDPSTWTIFSQICVWLHPSAPSSLLKYYFPVRLILTILLKLQTPCPAPYTQFGSPFTLQFFFFHSKYRLKCFIISYDFYFPYNTGMYVCPLMNLKYLTHSKYSTNIWLG